MPHRPLHEGRSHSHLLAFAPMEARANLMEHCYREITPSDDIIDDILICSRGSLARFASAARLAVEDWRDLRMAADAIRAQR